MSNHGPPTHDSESSHLPFLRRHWHWRLLGACAAGTLVLGTTGFLELQRGEPGAASFSNALYHSVQLFLLHSAHFEKPVPWTLDVGRWLGAVSTMLAVMEFARHALREELTAFHLRRLRGHVIVCGLGRKGLATVRGQIMSGKKVVVIEKSPAPDLAEACRGLGAHLLTGDAANPEILIAARVYHAAKLIALCPEDSTNCDIAAVACRLRADSPDAVSPLECRIQVGDTEARKALEDLLARPGHHKGRTVVRFFDSFDPEARRLLIHDLPLDHDGVKLGDLRQVHLVILGFGRMGRTLAVRAAQLGVFAQPGRLKISVIDRAAENHRKELLFHHAGFAEVCDIEFHQLEAISPETRDLLKQWCGRKDAVTSVAVCFDNEQRALKIALQLEPLIASNDVRVAVRFAGQSGLARLLEESGVAEAGRLRLRPFGMDDRAGGVCGAAPDPVEQFAWQIHAAYVEMRKKEDGQDPAKQQAPAKDEALRDWDDLPEDFRESSRQQADHIFIKARSLGYEVAPGNDRRSAIDDQTFLDKVEPLAELEHRRFMAERFIANWSLGPEPKNIPARTSPTLVPWEGLIKKYKDYDRKAVGMIPELLRGAGWKIVTRTGHDVTIRSGGEPEASHQA